MPRELQLLVACCWCCALAKAGWFGSEKLKPADAQPAAGFRPIGPRQALGVSAFALSLEVLACVRASRGRAAGARRMGAGSHRAIHVRMLVCRHVGRHLPCTHANSRTHEHECTCTHVPGAYHGRNYGPETRGRPAPRHCKRVSACACV